MTIATGAGARGDRDEPSFLICARPWFDGGGNLRDLTPKVDALPAVVDVARLGGAHRLEDATASGVVGVFNLEYAARRGCRYLGEFIVVVPVAESVVVPVYISVTVRIPVENRYLC